MSDGTSIEWTDASWNPVRAKYSTTDDVGQVLKTGWHCERVSPFSFNETPRVET